MNHTCLPLLAVAITTAILGCSSTDTPARQLTGASSARYSSVWPDGDPAERPRTVDVNHTFSLRNTGVEPVMLTAGRYTTNTVWQFVGTPAVPPRTIAPNETVEVAMRGRLYQPGARRFFVELKDDAGEVITLELLVDE